VLYGNADTNSAFARVLDLTDIDLRRDFVRIGDKRLGGESLALLAVRPRKDSSIASVAIIGGTGLIGCRTTDFRSCFSSGAGYPRLDSSGCQQFAKGRRRFRGAGFLKPDWVPVLVGETVWR